MMKFLVDVCTGLQVAEFLRSKGIDVLEAYKIDPHLSDVNILRLAVSEKRIINTIDVESSDLKMTYPKIKWHNYKYY